MGEPLDYYVLARQNAALRKEVAFWKDQHHFAVAMVNTIADLDEEAPALRQMLRTERARRHQVEKDLDRARYELLRLSTAVFDQVAVTDAH